MRFPPDHIARRMPKYADFFSASGCRDLLFHVCEHNYTIPTLFDLIEASGMRLETFTLPSDVAPTVKRAVIEEIERTRPGFAGTMFRFALARK